MSVWSALRADAVLYKRLRYPRGGWSAPLSLWLRPGGMLVLFTQRIGHELRTRRAAGARWTPALLLMLMVEHLANYATVVFAKCDVLSSVEIEPGVYLADGGHLIIGARRIGAGSLIHHCVTIGMNLADKGKPSLGTNVWIGPDTVIYGNITIGDGVTILPGTVLTKSVPAGAVVQGNPARVLRLGFDNAALRAGLAHDIDATSLPSPLPVPAAKIAEATNS
jgi:serine acetyltransferase